MAENPITDLTSTLTDAAYVAVGFGVIVFQKAQVRRREIEKQLAEFAADTEGRFEPVAEAVEAGLDRLDERLPDQAREVLKQVRTTAKQAGEQFRSAVRQPASV